MKVYVLLGHIPYEGGELLGVFSTPELAAEHNVKPCDSSGDRLRVDRYATSVHEVTLDVLLPEAIDA